MQRKKVSRRPTLDTYENVYNNIINFPIKVLVWVFFNENVFENCVNRLYSTFNGFVSVN